MTPTTSAPRSPLSVEPTHPCARCGNPVGPGIGLCEQCNPLGLRDVASGQVHGSVFIAVAAAIIVLAVLARLSIAGIGPFPANVDAVVPAAAGLTVTVTVTNEGDAIGQTTCRLSHAGDVGTGTAAIVTTPRLAGHETRTFDSLVSEFGSRRSTSRSNASPRDGDPVIPRRRRHAIGGGLEFAIALAARAGEILMDRYERLERIDYKSARDVVTEADHLSEELIIDAIRAYHPADAILAEESGEHQAIAGEAPTSGRGRVWIIDPLDGTVNYANGIPFFCVSIGLVVDGRPTVGVIHDPTRARRSRPPTTARRCSCRHSGRTASRSRLGQGQALRLRRLDGARAAARSRRANRNVRKAIRISRSMGSAALALAYVGNGRFDAFIQQGGLSAWDIAAAGLIAERGGATVTSMPAGPWFDIGHAPRSIGVLAAPPAHHATLLELVR